MDKLPLQCTILPVNQLCALRFINIFIFKKIYLFSVIATSDIFNLTVQQLTVTKLEKWPLCKCCYAIHYKSFDNFAVMNQVDGICGSRCSRGGGRGLSSPWR